MAATAVYANVCRIPENSSPGDSTAFSNINATPAAFRLFGGKYAVSVIASTFGTVTLEVLGPDGTTYLTALTAFSANGFAVVDLPPGLFKLVIA